MKAETRNEKNMKPLKNLQLQRELHKWCKSKASKKKQSFKEEAKAS